MLIFFNFQKLELVFLTVIQCPCSPHLNVSFQQSPEVCRFIGPDFISFEVFDLN